MIGNNTVYIGKGENNIIEINTDLNTKHNMPRDMIPEWLNLLLSNLVVMVLDFSKEMVVEI